MEKYKRIISVIFMGFIVQCAPIGIETPFSLKGSEVREYIREELLLVTLLDASLLRSGNPLERALGEYYTTLNLLAPLMVEIDDNAYYSQREAQKCAEGIADLAFFIGTDIAIFTCDLKPLKMVDIGSPRQSGGQ